MAWFRIGGAGISAALKTAMNAVLNKKFGTVLQDYAPETWPDTVNLMGPLEEKTVSGSIVAFSDGADDVPVKSWGVTLPASLTGYSSLTCKQAKANLLLPNNADRSGTTNSIAYSYDSTTQTFSFNGTNGKTDANWLIFNRSELTFDGLKIGATYYFSHTLPANMYAQITYKDTNNSTHALVYLAGNASKNASVSFTIPSDFGSLNNFQIGVARTLGAIDDTAVFMISAVASVDYAPYEAPTTATASLGRTIYGGTADVVKGQGESTHANVKVSDLTWTKQTASGRDFFISQVSNMKTGTPKEIDSVLPYGGEITVAAMADKSLASWTNSLRIYDTDITTVSELLEAYGNDGISYPLATPETFTFTPITPTPETALGDNTMWSDDGDLSVIYRSMGTVYQYTEGEEVYF